MPDHPLDFRDAVPADLPWCAEVMSTTDPWLALGRSYQQCLERLQRPGLDLVLATRDARPIGFILIHPTGLAGSPYIATVAVHSSARGSGIGTALLNHAEHRYTQARHIFLCVSSFNTRARALYLRHGYRQVGEIPDYVITGASELIFHKPLDRS